MALASSHLTAALLCSRGVAVWLPWSRGGKVAGTNSASAFAAATTGVSEKICSEFCVHSAVVNFWNQKPSDAALESSL